MLDLGWSEMAIIAAIALFVIGPKDLPKALRTLGHYGGKVRALAREFRVSIDEAVKESELEEVKNQIQSVTQIDLDTALDATEKLADKGEDPNSEGSVESGAAKELKPNTTAGNHFARFGEHYTKPNEQGVESDSGTAGSSKVEEKEDSADSELNLPSGVSQVVEARKKERSENDSDAARGESRQSKTSTPVPQTDV